MITVPVLAVLLGWWFRGPLLERLGNFLVQRDDAFKADVIVVLRGDEIRFDRAIKAADLFKTGFAPQIYVSSALDDLAVAALQIRGIAIRSSQANLVNILSQLGVPCDHVTVDAALPGGGTEGEMRRLQVFAKAHKITSAILVTSWFHSRRVKLIATAIAPDLHVSVIAADGEASERNWWRYRYIALTVLEEYSKLISYEIGITPKFADDPRVGESASHVRLNTGCDMAAGSEPP